MSKTILITGATDGIGLETAKILVGEGHRVLLHGRNPAKLDTVAQSLADLPGPVETYVADLSRLDEVGRLVDDILAKHETLDVLINNAGVFKTSRPLADNGMDVRFVVNTIAPYLLTMKLLPLIPTDGRVVNLSSAAQAPVNMRALGGQGALDDFDAYAQSKLAITMWTNHLAAAHPDGPVFVSVNPGSLLATKMVHEGFGVAGSDIGIGAGILVRAALSDEFADASGKYFDNDDRCFAPPHPAGRDRRGAEDLVQAIERVLVAA